MHGTHQRNHTHRHQGDDEQRHHGVKEIRDRLDKHGNALTLGCYTVLFEQARKISTPAGQRDQQTQRGRCRIHYIGQHGARRSKTISHRFHRGAYRQRVEVVIQKDQQAQAPGRQQTTLLGLYSADQRLAEGIRSSPFNQ